MPNETFAEIISKEFKKRDNPVNLKPTIIGKVVQISPIIVQIKNGKILLTENEELEISEWFRFRCDIDTGGALSSNVPNNLENAKNVTEIHSESGANCQMPDAIASLASAILGVRDELLALKCNLKQGDYASIASLDETNKYILLDKVLTTEASNKEG